ncbi:MAG: serine O-acetyltransferase [Candidatus Aureabacteria bacterium]|nr:serine O-acetyltransferase [Candidatus Auribacterota bacterium]
MLNIIKTIKERDPAARNIFEIVLTYSGFHALAFYRFAHLLYKLKIPIIPRFISQFAKFITGIEIHPGAEIARGFFIDHGMGVVIGETTVIGENCTLFQGVTLGGTGKERGKRHPTLGRNVVIGAGAKVLGNITIGDNSYVGANAVVLKDVPPDSTVVGIPGTVVKEKGKRVSGINLDHIHLPDPIAERLSLLQKEIDHIEREIKDYHNSKIRDDKK